MENQYAAILLSFPPESTPRDNAVYDNAAKNHLSQLSRILKENSAELIAYGPQLLEVRNPSTPCLEYLASELTYPSCHSCLIQL